MYFQNTSTAGLSEARKAVTGPAERRRPRKGQAASATTFPIAAMIGFYFGGSRPVGADVKPPPVVPDVKHHPSMPM
jgi:hypothetical protein